LLGLFAAVAVGGFELEREVSNSVAEFGVLAGELGIVNLLEKSEIEQFVLLLASVRKKRGRT